MFQKGDVSNPSGAGVLAKKNGQILKELLMKDVPRACEVIRECLNEKENKTWAAKEVLDRVFGKASQQVDVSGEAGQALTAVLRIITKAEAKQNDGVDS